ncbi:class F sortase [Streptomyces sp. uw30]|uniref:class F sortase n=1 Tax=Streptomyces sp. uw30 TaxID=1828179 RepID=UPI0011CE5470|nr:class F sortase [Streptomyces sp. uw30]TXS40590.1 class F sortase [Streptomyces sp. uw30]
MAEPERSTYGGRLLMGVAWTALLLGLWLWGREVTGVRPAVTAPVSGDVAAVGRPAPEQLPPAVRPLGDATPQRLDIPGLDLRAPVVARGLDVHAAIDPPPYEQAAAVGWYAAGVKPGAAGAALMVGHVDTESRPAVFHRLGALRPGATVRVLRDDGRVAEFTVDDVRVVTRDRFDAHQVYGAHRPGRAELRLITCAGTFDRATRDYTANVVVSAYLTGTGL